MAAIIQTWDKRATIDGELTSFLSVTTDHGVRTIGTCDLLIPSPVPAHVTVGAEVVVEASLDGNWLSTPLFTGEVRVVDPTVSANGATTRVSCQGPAYRLAYPLGRDVTWTGGAKAAPTTILSSPVHLGDDTIAWYADTTPVGITHDVTWTPSVDADFVWVTLDLHGTNSYDASIGDKKIKHYSKLQVIQDGEVRGYANFPVSNEQWGSELDYTDKDNWDEDEELYIAARIRVADGDVTFRFKSGLKPGTSQRDEYEVDDVTIQTAGKQTLRRIVRGMLAKSGIPLAQRDVYQVTDLDGDTIYLGGNGLVDAGQIRIEGKEQPLSWLSNVLDLFGFVLFDSPDGVVRVRPFRGQPTGDPVFTFEEQVNIISVSDASNDPSRVYNSVSVRGASGSDENGKRFAYTYRTDPGDVAANPVIPDPPGEHTLTLSSTLLTSDDLCEQAGEIAEVNNSDATTITFETWPHAIRPNNTIAVIAPTADIAATMRVENVRTTIDASGYRQTIAAWIGTAVPFSETEDPDPSETDIEPADPRPDDEWVPYNPLAGVS